MIGRAAGLVAPASTRFLVDDIMVKRRIELLAPSPWAFLRRLSSRHVVASV